MIVKLAQNLPAFEGEESRVRCFLHIVNLIAKAIIRQFDASKGGLEVEEDDGSGNEVDEVDDDDDDDDNDGDDDDDDDDVVLESIQPVRVTLNKVCLHHAFLLMSADASFFNSRFVRFLSRSRTPRHLPYQSGSRFWIVTTLPIG